MGAGLTTEQEERLAERTLAEAEYDLESARRSVKTTLGELRTETGSRPTLRYKFSRCR